MSTSNSSAANFVGSSSVGSTVVGAAVGAAADSLTSSTSSTSSSLSGSAAGAGDSGTSRGVGMLASAGRWIFAPVALARTSSDENGQVITTTGKSWLKIALITGCSATGIAIMGSYVMNRYFYQDPPDKKKKPQRMLNNGSVNTFGSPSKTSNGTRVHTSSILSPTEETWADTVDSRQLYSLPAGRRDSSGSTASTLRATSRSRQNSFGSTHGNTNRRRPKRDITHPQVGLILKSSSTSPQELLFYGYDSLKTSLKLLEASVERCKQKPETLTAITCETELSDLMREAKALAEKMAELNKRLAPAPGSTAGSQAGGSVYGSPDHQFPHSGGTGAVTIDEDWDEDSASIADSLASGSTLTFYDVEPNIHFFKLFTTALDNVDDIPPPRVDRSLQMGCDSEIEFIAKVGCLRSAFTELFSSEENYNFFVEVGQQVLETLMRQNLQEPESCVAAYQELLGYISIPENLPIIDEEVAGRKIPAVSFYDIVLCYFVLDSFDDIENPPPAVAQVASNRWLGSGFREYALRTAVAAVLRHKKARLLYQDGFFAHFYALLETVSPILAWGFLGSDEDLKLKCNLIKESIQDLIRDLFSFDRVRYTTQADLCEDILRVARERIWELNNKLTICA